MLITDITGNTEMLTGYKGAKRNRKVNGERTLAFLVLPTSQNAHSFGMVNEESIVEFDDETYRIKQVSEKSKGNTFYKEVVAIHTFFDLIDDYIYDQFTGGMTFEGALHYVLDGTDYTWDIVDTFIAQDIENFGDDNRLSLFQSLLTLYGAEYTLDGTHLTFRQKIGNATDFQFRYNYNVKTISRDVNTTKLSTYIKGYGKQNDDGTYVVESEYTSPNSSIFGIRHAKPIHDDRLITTIDLNARLQAALSDEPDVSITIDFVDLRRAGYPFDVPNVGDDVFLIYEPMGLDLEVRLAEIEEEFTESSDLPIKTTVTLANVYSTVTDTLTNTQKQVGNVIGDDGKVRYNALDDAVKRATESLQSAQTELEFVNGIIARSKTNPNDLVILNSNGFGISRDGGTTFTEAITAAGFALSAGAIGQLAANNIQIGVGTTFDDGFSPDEIKTDANGYADDIGQGVRDDLRLSTPLPTSLTLSQDGITASTSTSDKYVRLDYRGMFVNKGAIQIQRADGYNVMMDGIIKNGFNLFSAYPPFRTAGAKEMGPWVQVATTNRYETINSYTFRHDSQYILVAFGLYTDNNITGYMAYDLSDYTGTTDLGNLGTSTNSGPDADSVYTYQLDLGVPTGQLRRLNIRLYGSDPNWGVYGRILYIAQEG